MVAEFLVSVAKAGVLEADASSLAPSVSDGLVAEEWAEEAVVGLRIRLDTVERDWLSLVAAAPQAPSERSQARALQDFLIRVRQHRQQRVRDSLLTSVHKKLLALPETNLPKVFEANCLELHPPSICSVSSERAGTAELFWCYGFRPGRGEGTEAGSVLLIVLCAEAPSISQVEGWHRQLEKEARLFPMEESPAALPASAISPRQELWLLVPNGTSLACLRGERRFPSSTFLLLLEQSGTTRSNPESSRQV